MSGGEAADRFASVAVPVPPRRLFTYEVPAALRESVRPGDRVRVRFGGRVVTGTIVAWPGPQPDAGVEVRAIEEVLAAERRVPRELLELTRFVADYYLCSWGEAIEAALAPAARRAAAVRAVCRLPGADAEGLPARATAQRGLLRALPADGRPLPLSALSRSAREAVKALEKRGWVRVVEVPGGRPGPSATRAAGAAAPPPPTAAQAAVLEELAPALAQRAYRPFLLYGATGSGKTEVYLRAAQRALEAGRGVLYLVPEIGLTPLLLARIERRFPGQVAVLHSGLSRRERREAWEAVRDGRRRVVIGTRSAVFAPLPDPGLIVVDEEQDTSYKQEETPRYNGRDLAVVRARSARAVIVLGSATPSMESFHHARAGRYRLLRLGGRIEERPLAEVRVVDMRLQSRAEGEVVVLSSALVEALRACLAKGEQALVLRNRRGWAAALFCPACGTRVVCDRCSISLTWHHAARRLRCHHCGFERGRPPGCPSCGFARLRMLGEGTEQVENLLRGKLPGAVIERMDRDTIRRRGAHERLLRRFEAGAIDVLVGTQMIAKGHDFPRVTLVGVLSADQALGLPDFRAGERAFQLLTQVAGRAGRGDRRGTVIIQAFEPEHPVIRLAAVQDYEAFFEREIVYRRALRYPPLTALVELLVSDPEAHRARRWAAELADALREEAGARALVAGPGPAPVERLAGRYREQILVRSAGRRRLVEAVDRAVASCARRLPRRALQVDVDPVSLL